MKANNILKRKLPFRATSLNTPIRYGRMMSFFGPVIFICKLIRAGNVLALRANSQHPHF